MTTIQLKKKLMHQISNIDDIHFLNALKTIIETKTRSDTIKLSNEQIEAVNQSKSQIENKQFSTQDELNQEFEKWLSIN